MKSVRPYEKVLKEVKARGDIWMVSQGEYIRWWQRRDQASLKVIVSGGECTIGSNLAEAVFQKLPQEFLDSNKTSCNNGSFSGEVQFVIDVTLERKNLLIEALKREGIMNFTTGEGGEFFLSHELDHVLERMEINLRRGEWRAYNQTIDHVRDAAVAKLAEYGLPLIRVWYHPRIDGKIIRAVFSPRFDVDRAITNMPKIRRLERKHDVSSTAYLRVFHPFYTDKEIRWLASLPYCGEIALHAEFTRHAQQYGSELAAAKAEKAHLERIVGRPVEGVSIHGGEVLSNMNQNSYRVMENCGFTYDTAHGPLPQYFPYRLLNEDGQLENTYRLRYHFRDIGVPFDDYAEAFYKEAMRRLEEVLEHNGVLVLLLHPEYFGFFSYILNPRNLVRFTRFLPSYLIRTFNLGEDQKTLKPENETGDGSPGQWPADIGGG